MIKKTLASLIKEIVTDQTTSLGEVVSNLHGPSVVGEQTIVPNSTVGTWRIHTLPIVDAQYSPDEIVGRLSTIQQKNSPVVQSFNGVLDYIAVAGNSLATTIIDSPQAVGIRVEVDSPNRQIAVYVDETLIRRGFGRLVVTVNIPAGKIPLNIVTVGTLPQRVTIGLPTDINASIQSFIPNAPNWLESSYANPSYVDPKTGAAGIQLKWHNQENVGGWGVYRVEEQPYGVVSGAYSFAGRYFFTVINSGTVPYPSSVVKVENKLIGVVDTATTDNNNGLFITIIPFSTVYDGTVFSGTFSVLSYTTIGTVVKNSSESEINFVDLNVKNGEEYSYTLDAYSLYDSSLRSTKAATISVTAGDVFPPSSIILTTVIGEGGFINAFYTPPADEDYLGTKVVKYYLGSGTGQIVNTPIVTDFGLPSTPDSLVFSPIGSGTYYFITFDQVGNTQHVLSGVPFFFTGSGIGQVENNPPTISIAQLSSAEMTTDPRLFASFKLQALDDNIPGPSVVQYIITSGTSASWITAPTNPFTLTMGRSNRDGWIRARAFDGELYSDEIAVMVDFDTTPELSTVYGRYIVSSGTVYVTAIGDDDTKSARWYIDQGAEMGDPTVSNSTLVSDVSTNKVFNFSFSLTNGKKKILVIVPYPDTNGNGTAGLPYREEFNRLPRTKASVQERTTQGGVTRTDVLVTLSTSPDTAIVYNRLMPVRYGTVTSGTTGTLTDDTATWSSNQFITSYEVTIVEGKGINQTRNINFNNQKTLNVTPDWVEIPDSTSKYHINEKFRHYSDRGKVTSAGSTFITDTSKSWYNNVFVDKHILIYSGTGVGQQTFIVSGSTSTVSVSPAFSITPDSTSGYKIFGERAITRDSGLEKTYQFFATVPETGLTEEAQSIIVDEDDIPEIGSGSFTQLSASQCQVRISQVDEDAKTWSLWARKGSWPTVSSGTAYAEVDFDFRRFNGATSTSSLTFDAGTGWWYFIAIPYDSFENAGDRLIFSGVMTPAPTPPPSISNISVTNQAIFGAPGGVNKLEWDHNDVAEKPGGSDGTVTIRIWAYRSDLGQSSEHEITDPDTRYAWNDIGPANGGWDNNDNTQRVLLHGSMAHFVYQGSAWKTWFYTLRVYDSGVLKGEFETQISGNYGDQIWSQ